MGHNYKSRTWFGEIIKLPINIDKQKLLDKFEELLNTYFIQNHKGITIPIVLVIDTIKLNNSLTYFLEKLPFAFDKKNFTDLFIKFIYRYLMDNHKGYDGMVVSMVGDTDD